MFINNGYWGKTQYMLEKGLDAEMLRRKVIADNIANVDVPHFKRSDVTFEAQLRRALDSEAYVAANEVPAKTTNERHIPFFRPLDFHSVTPKARLDYQSSMRNDGNNVDIEHEMGESLKNQMRYQLLADHMAQNYRTMGMIIRKP